MKYTRTYADPLGISHFEDVEVKLKQTNFAPPAPPLFLSSFSPASQYAFCTLPADWYGDWHPTPKKQFSFILSGELEVQTGDGELRRFSPGSIRLMEDTSGKGHTTRVVGASDVLAAIIQLPD